MRDTEERSSWWLWLVGAIVVLLFLGSCPRDSADTELARTARDAVKMAHDAQDDDRSAMLWTGRFRMLALILGVTVPITVAYLIWRSTCTGEIDPVEVIAELERRELPTLRDSSAADALPTAEPTDAPVASPN